MRNQITEPVWITIAVIIIGVGSLVTFSMQPSSGVSATDVRQQAAQVTPVPSAVSVAVAAAATITPSFSAPTLAVETTPKAVPTSTFTPLPPLALPEVPVPENGQTYTLLPSDPLAVGWVQSNDEVINHFGDYNIFAGVFNGQQHVGAVQFDLSAVPPGSPILYADLTLTGLVDEYLSEEGTWTVQMLNNWMDENWTQSNYYWLAREDSGSITLNAPVANGELAAAKANTFSIPPEGLSMLESRLFAGKASFRILGPAQGGDNLFGWDSGFGERSLGRAPVLRIVTGGPALDAPPTPTPNYVVVTPLPTDGAALLALAAERLTATAAATAVTGTPPPTATPTPFPPNWVTPAIVTNTPTPENEATAVWWSQVATAQAIVLGTPLPTPPNVWTATPTPLPPPSTPTPMVMPYDSLTATPTSTSTPGALPNLLPGKILFYSDRIGETALMVMNPDGSNVNVWTGGSDEWVYAQAMKREAFAPGGGQQVVVSQEQISSLQLWTIDFASGARSQLTHMNNIAYDPVWSPTGNTIAFVSPEPGNDEIFIINADGSNLTQLTFNEWEWDKHPSWSPDGSQLVFMSNRDSQRQQIWIMNADGSNPRNLSNNKFNDWDPVWVK
jgi:hypothetical protein